MSKNPETIVPDTSIIIEAVLSKMITKGELKPKVIIFHEAVLAELEHQANQNKNIGFLGITEIETLRKLSQKKGFEVKFSGVRPKFSDIKYAHLGEIDTLIRDLAFDENATLITADKVQHHIATAKGIDAIFVEASTVSKKIKLESFFDEKTMSVHLREEAIPYAKKGAPGNWQFVKIQDKIISRDELKEINREIIEEANMQKDGFIEIERKGSTIVQLRNYRIVITKPPFSDGWEITAVRPVKKLNLPDYKLTEKLMLRISEQAEGILIAGSPGMGKSTFAQALAEYYEAKGKIVKTIEAPRDLVLPEAITQYAISHGSSQEVHDVLLLTRPDYTIFDEMRNTADFALFADLRLSGIGLAGVVHATKAIDAIQRFVGRIELGVIPQVIDTVIFISKGAVDQVLSLNMSVKVPEGMTEDDLARPVVVVTDFEEGKPMYEMYSYGEETVVVPISAQQKKSPARALAEKSIEAEIKRTYPQATVDVCSDNRCEIRVPEKDMAKIIGKEGKNISALEKKIGISIDVKPLEKQQTTSDNKPIDYHAEVSKKNVVFTVDKKYANNNVHIMIDEDYLMTANVGKAGSIKISKRNKIGKMIADAVVMGEKVKILL